MIAALAPAHRFALTALAWSLALFAALRLSWIDLTVVGWLIETQRDLAVWYGATPTRAVVVDASCSGSDVIALCLAVTLSYPVAWRLRLLGAAGGTLLILVLNTARIGTLFNTVSQPALFNALHLYVWPAILVTATGLYVLVWTSRVGLSATPGDTRAAWHAPWMRFGLTALAFLAVHAAAAPWTMTSTAILRVGTWTAGAAEGLLTTLGVAARASGHVLITNRGAFAVTQECLLTPLVPIYLAATVALPMRGRTRAWMLLAALPVFFVLGIVRVLVLALPPAIAASPIFLAHGFYQVVAGAVLIALASAWALSRSSEPVRHSQIAGRAIVAAGTAALTAIISSTVWSAMPLALAGTLSSLAPHALTSWTVSGDAQGALPMLPGYQLGFLAGLWMALSPFRRPGRFAWALAALLATQVVLLVAVGEVAVHAGFATHALLLRASAIGVPAALAWLLFRPRNTGTGSYDDFWYGVGRDFPDLGGAPSTELYRRDEIALLSSQVDDWHGLRVLKTDLWDEARNTRILQWLAGQGAEVYGIDISAPTIAMARDEFGTTRLHASRADVRQLPFADASFDVIYSMGTIEHFDESEDAVCEMARVLKPGGRLILGVPNRFDPFLRPVFVWFLWVLGLYGYGFEKSYSRRALRRMSERAGLSVVEETGILFIPGWLRMADLQAHTRPHLARRVTAWLVRIFGRLSQWQPGLRKHGYLLTAVSESPR